MIAVFGALLPLFVLIALGYAARRIGRPALLFTSRAGTSLAGSGAVALALAMATIISASTILSAITLPAIVLAMRRAYSDFFGPPGWRSSQRIGRSMLK